MKGYFGIGVERPKTSQNMGTLYRTAYQLGASFVFTIGSRYRKEPTDTPKAYRYIPMIQYKDLASFMDSPLYDCQIIGVEKYREPRKQLASRSLHQVKHPDRAIYLLGAEDTGLTKDATKLCDQFIEIPSERDFSYNVHIAGSLVMWDRYFKELTNN